MRLDCRLADVELLADLRVREAARNQTKHVQLALRQLAELLRRLSARNARELLDHPLRDRGGQQRVSAGHDPDRLEELLGRVVLQDESAGAGSERLVDVLVQVERRQDQHPGRVVGGEDPPRRLEPVELRHADVHEHDGRVEAGGLVDRLEPVARLGDDLDVRLTREQHAEARPDHRLVIGDEDAHAHIR